MKKKLNFLLRTSVIILLLSGCNLPRTNPNNPPTSSQTPQASLSTSTEESQDSQEPQQPEGPDGSIPLIFSHGGAPCDIDAMVYFAKHPHVDLIGMVLTRGEFHPEEALEEWAVFMYDVLGMTDSRIALGTDERMDPYSHEFPESWRLSADEFWGLSLPEGSFQYEVESGPEMIIDLINHSPEKVTIIAMASMIDVALAIQQDPGIIDNIEQVVIMGGAFNVPGNLADAPYPISNQVAEWNIWIDAAAADFLLNSGAPVSIVPLDATLYLNRPQDVAYINTINDPWVSYVAQIWNLQIGWYSSGFLIWDTITAAAVTDPELFDWVYDEVEVITDSGDLQGQTVPLETGSEIVRYAVDADYNRIMEIILETYAYQSSASEPEVITELAGEWIGDAGVFTITFILGDSCVIGEICGTFSIPEFPLTGDVTIVNVVGSRYEFLTSNLSSGDQLVRYEYLELLPDGTISYYTTDYTTTDEAILHRQ